MKVVLKTDDILVVDDFLDMHTFDHLYDYVCKRDYKHINTEGQVAKVWRLRDGFPLRSVESYFRSYENKASKQVWEFPVNNPMDDFANNMDSALSLFQQYVGTPGEKWNRFSVTSWMYPRGTGLSLHEDSGPYSGAYTFFMNKQWNLHWGGLLMVLPAEASERIEEKKKAYGEAHYRLKKWVDTELEDEAVSGIAAALTILPKPNRLVVMSNRTHHLVSTINNSAGDEVRISVAGFFELKSK